MKIIFDYNRTIYDPETGQLYPSVIELLRDLSAHHELFLVSQYESVRKKQVADLGIARFFKEIVFVPSKTKSLFQDLAGRSKNAMVVGDRVQSEIYLGNELGLVTVWFRRGKFRDEVPVDPREQPRHIIKNLNELYAIVALYE